METFAEKVSNILFKNDPAFTMCVENDAYDEYDMISSSIDYLIWHDGCAVDYSVRNALCESFEPDDLHEEHLANAIAEIENIVNGD